MKTQTIEIASLYARGSVNSVNEKNRTVDLIFSTGAPVDRVDGYGRYREVLSMDPKHVRLDRLNGGAPLLNSHSAYSISDVIGTVEPGSARMADGRGLATVRFSRRDDVEAIWQDVLDGIIRSVSVGYRVHKFQEDAAKPGTLTTRTAVDWEPFELSMVSIPADHGAKVRADWPPMELNRCEIWPASTVAEQDAERIRRFERLSAAFPIEPDDPTVEDAAPAPLVETARTPASSHRHQMSLDVAGVGPMLIRWNDDGRDTTITTRLGRDLALATALEGALRYIEELTGENAALQKHQNLTIKRVLRNVNTKEITGTMESCFTV